MPIDDIQDLAYMFADAILEEGWNGPQWKIAVQVLAERWIDTYRLDRLDMWDRQEVDEVLEQILEGAGFMIGESALDSLYVDLANELADDVEPQRGRTI